MGSRASSAALRTWGGPVFRQPLRRMLAAAWLGALPVAWAAPGAGITVEVGQAQPGGAVVQLRMRVADGSQPVLHWAGAVKRMRNALVILRQPDGTPVPAGTRVRVTPGGQEFIVARRGEVYLMDVQADNQIDVRFKGGGCVLPLVLDAAGGTEARIGPLACGAKAP